MSKYKSYEKYLGSNLDWLGKIPAHWKPNYIKGITKTYSEKGKPELELLSVYRDYGVIKKSSRDDNHNKPGMDLSSYKVVHPNTLVLNKMKTWSGSLGVSNYFGIVSPAYITCKIDLEQVETKYLNYLLRCKNYVFEYNRLSYGVRPSQWDMRYQDFKSIPIYLPPKEEQTTIARFLDYKLAKINRFIRKKKQLIKLLNEQKAAIINQAVTKGLDPNVKMKDSGIEWLGEIPEHWEKHKLKYLISKPIAGAWGAEPQNDDNDITCVRVADFSEYEIKTDNLTIRNIEAKTEQILKPGDLLLEKSGGGEKTPVGRVVLFNQSFKAVTSNFVSKFSPKIDLVSSEYLLYMFKLINSVRWNFRSLKQTTGIQNIDTYQYMDNWVFIPKIEEQKIIVNHIKSEFKILDETITKIEKEIALVEEYKTALIAETVTGKIDVRGYEVPEISEEETYEEIEEEISITSEDAAEYENESDL